MPFDSRSTPRASKRPVVTAASEATRRMLSDLTTTASGTISGADIVGQDVYDMLAMYFTLTVEVDPDNRRYVQVWRPG